MNQRLRPPMAVLLIIALVAPLGCDKAKKSSDKLIVYCGRSKGLVDPIVRLFEKRSDIAVTVRYGSTAQLAVTLIEEGDAGLADVFWAQDGGALGAIARTGLFAPLDQSVLETVPAPMRSASGLWVATSGRARVLAYAPRRVNVDQLPTSVFDLTEPKWKGRVGWAPANASFQAFVTAMRKVHGDQETRRWLDAMERNDTQRFAKNTPIIKALADGQIDLGLPNHYYLLRFKKSDGRFPVEQRFFAPGDVGNLVNVAGVGILKHGANRDAADRFVEFLLSPTAQQYFTSEVFEYPVTDQVIINPKLVDRQKLLELVPKVVADDLNDLQATLRMLREAGLL